MEKLAYALWKGDSPADAFRERLLAKLASRLPTLGAENLAISVIDSDVAAGGHLHMGARKPDALLTFWMECSQDRGPLEERIDYFSEKMAGYLVVESRPMVYDSPVPPGERTPGFSLVGFILPKEGISHDAFVKQWYDVQRDTAIETQSTFHYVRNEVVRPLTPDAPPWNAIVEEGFPSEALDSPHVFYDADGSEERYQAHLARMMASVEVFIDLENIDSHPMSEYRF
jgi:hypothetical protein